MRRPYYKPATPPHPERYVPPSEAAHLSKVDHRIPVGA